MPIKTFALFGLLFAGSVCAACSRISSAQFQQSTSQQTVSDGSVAEDLTFTGQVAGHTAQGRPGDTYVCLPATMGPIVGKIGDFDYTFEYRGLNVKDPGIYKVYAQIGPVNNKNVYYGSDNVQLTLNDDKRSGSVEGDLVNLNNSSEKVHISGSWKCPADL